MAKRKVEREASWFHREAKKLQKVVDALAVKAFKAKWFPEALRDARQGLWDELHAIQRRSLSLVVGSLPPASIHIPKLCLDN